MEKETFELRFLYDKHSRKCVSGENIIGILPLPE